MPPCAFKWPPASQSPPIRSAHRTCLEKITPLGVTATGCRLRADRPYIPSASMQACEAEVSGQCVVRRARKQPTRLPKGASHWPSTFTAETAHMQPAHIMCIPGVHGQLCKRRAELSAIVH